MTVYQYIATSSPDAAFEICKNHGFYDVQNLDELSNCLQVIVANGGENSLKEVMSLHPDKEVLIELFDKKKSDVENFASPNVTPVIPPPVDCSCNKESKKSADGTNVSNLANQTNTYILVGALIVSIAIISLNKSKNG